METRFPSPGHEGEIMYIVMVHHQTIFVCNPVDGQAKLEGHQAHPGEYHFNSLTNVYKFVRELSGDLSGIRSFDDLLNREIDRLQ